MDACDCLNYCGDDPWLAKGLAKPCAKFYFNNPEQKPRPIYLPVFRSTDMFWGAFSPLE